MKDNRLRNIFKGLAAAGIAAGTASTLQPSDMVYAAEMAQTEQEEAAQQEYTSEYAANSYMGSESLSAVHMYSGDSVTMHEELADCTDVSGDFEIDESLEGVIWL